METKSQNTMSKAKEMLDNHRMQDYEDYYTTPDDERHYIFTESGIKDLLQAHTRQRLDDLKEKVEENLELRKKAEVDDEWDFYTYKEATDDLIALIDEVRNE